MSAHTKAIPNTGWLKELTAYTHSHTVKAVWQLLNTILPYFVLWAGMIYFQTHGFSYWIVLLLSLPAAGLMVRTFILFHDCCHGSFFPSRKANRWVGYLTGILAFTPFEEWRRLHNMHHATSGNLNRRGTGDIWTMTVDEYCSAGKGKRLGYRLFRNPFILMGLGPIFLFLISNRIVHPDAKREDRRSVWVTNMAIIVIAFIVSWFIGFQNYLLIQFPILFFAGLIGIWLFFVQHQYEDAYWSDNKQWSLVQSALNGSSFYKLPKIFQWFSGNIGFHHIHHLRPGIPNYNLERCNEDVPTLSMVKPLTLKKSLQSLKLHLWDEKQEKLVSFRSVTIN